MFEHKKEHINLAFTRLRKSKDVHGNCGNRNLTKMSLECWQIVSKTRSSRCVKIELNSCLDEKE